MYQLIAHASCLYTDIISVLDTTHLHRQHSVNDFVQNIRLQDICLLRAWRHFNILQLMMTTSYVVSPLFQCTRCRCRQGRRSVDCHRSRARHSTQRLTHGSTHGWTPRWRCSRRRRLCRCFRDVCVASFWQARAWRWRRRRITRWIWVAPRRWWRHR